MTSKEIRETFQRYFEERGHRRVHSAPLLPDDPTLLFTNAGMNQFKGIFLGRETREYTRATSAQKCMRVGGKHNDLDDVGKDTYHHTLFEMLGNWSFGDYYKKEAIEFAWEFLTRNMGLPGDRLWATVYLDDDEAETLWKQVTPVDPERIRRFGEKDNFWQPGDTGPCGPCSEIHLDLGPEYGCGRPDCEPNCPRCEVGHVARYMELWNLVFIQFDRNEAGELTELPAKHVDTGLGFERVCAITQGVDSDYDTDLFRPILREIEEITGRSYDEGSDEERVAFQVLSDHIRPLTFSIADGILPSNEGRGYVLRRILRRAARYGRVLGMHEPFLYRLTSPVVDVMGEAYPEVVQGSAHASLVIEAEEEGFGRTLDRGIEIFERISERGDVSGEDAFRLYDTYGFPLDLTQLMAEEKGLSVDVDGFEREMAAQRERARHASQFVEETESGAEWIVLQSDRTHSTFVGYETTDADAEVVQYRITDTEAELVLDATPFYAAAGGQVGDTGEICGDGLRFDVTDTIRVDEAIVHRGRFVEGDADTLRGPVRAQVDTRRRAAIARNHTTTHLLHHALRQVLGEHVRQSGSLVAPDRLRFDFTHFVAMTSGEQERVEDLVNERIRENSPVFTLERSLDEAKAMGAIALFGEKYGEQVRTVQVDDYSLELCGGTHMHATGGIGHFVLLSEGAIAAGIRRIEAATGEAADAFVRGERNTLSEIAERLNVPSGEVSDRIEGLLARTRELEQDLQRARKMRSGSEVDDLIGNAEIVSGIKVVTGRMDVPPGEALRDLGDVLRGKLGTGVAVIGSVSGGKVSILAVVTDDLIQGRGLKAGDIVKDVAKIVGGGGGGRPHLAQAGGRNPEKLEEALAEVKEIVADKLT